jgi:hypothetical protein
MSVRTLRKTIVNRNAKTNEKEDRSGADERLEFQVQAGKFLVTLQGDSFQIQRGKSPPPAGKPERTTFLGQSRRHHHEVLID